MQVNVTGTTGQVIGSLLSLPHATLSGLVNAAQGKSFDDAADEVINTYAAKGEKIGRDYSDAIVGVLKDVAKHAAKEQQKKSDTNKR